MQSQNKFVCVFAGSEITVNLLKAEMEHAGIMSNVVNEYIQSNFRGFSTGTPYSVDLYILDTDLEKAKPIVDEFLKINKM